MSIDHVDLVAELVDHSISVCEDILLNRCVVGVNSFFDSSNSFRFRSLSVHLFEGSSFALSHGDRLRVREVILNGSHDALVRHPHLSSLSPYFSFERVSAGVTREVLAVT
ncbi:hypothetical protein DJ80_02460 [Halorubrum ezzemoulense]|uniref:Uncharacterized protein n=1 Tax=Halorubrum ezzemoulense TaxID=337243 RepID=A0A256J946_HALEZ|nr:hypothetical protein DJ80_02460 [Halorubrum ezzemoulense]